MSALEIFAVVISLIGVILTVRRNMWCWGFNLLAFVLYGYLFYTYQLYGETILQLAFFGLNIYGLYHWWSGKQIEHKIRIESLSRVNAVLQLGLALVAGAIFGGLLYKFTNAALPILDAQLAAFSLLATYWTSRKYIATWRLWVVVDIVYVAMFSYKALYLTAALYAAFVLLAIWGWIQWKEVKRAQQLEQESFELDKGIM